MHKQKIFLSELFINEIDVTPSRVVYVYRDFRDVAISAFFYWNRYKEEHVRKTCLSSLITLPPLDWYKYYQNRRKLLNYIEKLCKAEIDWFEEFTGTWSQHIEGWRNIGNELPGLSIKFVSYEKLLFLGSCLKISQFDLKTHVEKKTHTI